MKNAVRTICDMRLRPEVYSQVEEELKVLLVEVQNGKDIIEARKEAYILISTLIIISVSTLAIGVIFPLLTAFILIGHGS